jgi:hypothetical protein
MTAGIESKTLKIVKRKRFDPSIDNGHKNVTTKTFKRKKIKSAGGRDRHEGSWGTLDYKLTQRLDNDTQTVCLADQKIDAPGAAMIKRQPPPAVCCFFGQRVRWQSARLS